MVTMMPGIAKLEFTMGSHGLQWEKTDVTRVSCQARLLGVKPGWSISTIGMLGEGQVVMETSSQIWSKLHRCKKSGQKYVVFFMKDEKSIREDQDKLDKEMAKKGAADDERRKKEAADKKVAEQEKKKAEAAKAQKEEYWDKQKVVEEAPPGTNILASLETLPLMINMTPQFLTTPQSLRPAPLHHAVPAARAAVTSATPSYTSVMSGYAPSSYTSIEVAQPTTATTAAYYAQPAYAAASLAAPVAQVQPSYSIIPVMAEASSVTVTSAAPVDRTAAKVRAGPKRIAASSSPSTSPTRGQSGPGRYEGSSARVPIVAETVVGGFGAPFAETVVGGYGAPSGQARAQQGIVGTITDALFRQIDSNHDGVITRAEFRNALKNNVVSPGP
jgi:hypothetical protein